MDDLKVLVTFHTTTNEHLTPRMVAAGLKSLFMRFDVGETRLEFVGGDPDDIHDVKKELGMA